MAVDTSTLLNAGGTAAMSAINPAAAILGGIPELVKLGTGIGQAIQANQLGKRYKRPTFQIPASAQRALEDQMNLAYGTTPGLSLAQNQLAQNQAGSIAAIQGSGGGQAETLAALTQLDRNAGVQANELGAMQEGWAAQQMQNLINERNRFADYQQQKWRYDIDEPYKNAMDRSSQLREAGAQNRYDALRSIGGLGASVIGFDKDAGGGTPEAGKAGLAGGGVSSAIQNAMRRANPANIQGITPRTPTVATEPSLRREGEPGTAPYMGYTKKAIQFNPQDGADQTYDFNQVADDAAKSKLGFDPQAGADQGYDFNYINSRQPSKVPYGSDTGVQPTDNTPIAPRTPSLQARQADLRINKERSDYFKSRYGNLFGTVNNLLGGNR